MGLLTNIKRRRNIAFCSMLAGGIWIYLISIIRPDPPPVGTVTLLLLMSGAIWVSLSLLVFMFYLIVDFYPEEQHNMKIIGTGAGLKCGLLFILCFGLLYISLDYIKDYASHLASWEMGAITYGLISLFFAPWIYYCTIQLRQYKDQKHQQSHTGRYAPIPPKPANQEAVTISFDNALSLIRAQTMFNMKDIASPIGTLFFVLMALFLRHPHSGYVMAIIFGSLFCVGMLFLLYGKYMSMKRAARLLQFYGEQTSPAIRIDQLGMTIPILFFSMDGRQDYFLNHSIAEVTIHWQQITRWRFIIDIYKLDFSEKLAGSDYTSICLRCDLIASQRIDLLDIVAPYLSVAIERE